MDNMYDIILYPEGETKKLRVNEHTKPGAWLYDEEDREPELNRWWQLETIDHDAKRATGRLIDPMVVESNKKVRP